MQLNTQRCFDLFEKDHTLYGWDIETAGFNADYAQVLCISIKPHGLEPVTFSLKKGHSDKAVVNQARNMLGEAECWMTYYGKGFDVKILNTRLLYWGLPALDSIPHIDLYYALKSKLKTGSKSQAHLLNFLELPEEKMTVRPSIWANLNHNFEENMKVLIERCESDCEGMEGLYDRTRHMIMDAKR